MAYIPTLSMATSSCFPLFSLLPAIPKGSHFQAKALAVQSSAGEANRDSFSNLNYEHEEEKKKTTSGKGSEFNGLTVLYDDGFGTQSAKDYFAAAKEIIKPDCGPPRWFCPVECGQPIKNSPVLMFLPGIDGTGMGLILHHKLLGKVFEVRCLHIPVHDRTPFEGLVKFVEDSIRDEHALFPNRPIYLLGESLGGSLALAVAARNTFVDLILVLVNPATSYNRSVLQPFIPVLETLPDDLLLTGLPYALSMMMGDPLKIAIDSITKNIHQQTLAEFLDGHYALNPHLSEIAGILPRDTFLWILKLIKSGAAYTNSRLHAVKAQVLLLASGKDNVFPSGDEADRLWRSLKNCKVRYFKDNTHALLLEDGFNLLSVIKATATYRRSRQHDFVSDYLPPTISEYKKLLVQDYSFLRLVTSPALFSTLDDGRIVRGLSGVPNEGPVLLVGNHMLMGLEIISLVETFLREKNILVRGLAFPYLFARHETSREEPSFFDVFPVFGALPVSPINMYRVLSEKSFALLYPGGAREALHRKGEEYKLFWPNHPEFVRMAARFNATIVPFGVVGEDDIAEVVLDYNDLMKNPIYRAWIEDLNQENIATRLRTNEVGEVSEQDMHLPGILPKIPGRFYYLFGKPITTRGVNIDKDQECANELYLRVKSEIESSISYLKKKREEDPYRSIVTRTIYQNLEGHSSEVPTFEP